MHRQSDIGLWREIEAAERDALDLDAIFVPSAAYRANRANKEFRAIDRERGRRSLVYYLLNHVYTVDNHHQHPLRRLPLRAKPYLLQLAMAWLKEPLLACEKSRQMLLSWLFVAIGLWDTQRRFGALTFFQSKKEEDAAMLIDRAWVIWQHQPRWAQEPAKKTFSRISFERLHSMIWGIPQGKDQVRSHTASMIVSDEMGHQVEAEEAFVAAKPTIDGGGRYVAISTANPGFFERLVKDQM